MSIYNRIKVLIMLYLQELETDNWLKGLDKVVPLAYSRWEAMCLSQIYLRMDLPQLITWLQHIVITGWCLRDQDKQNQDLNPEKMLTQVCKNEKLKPLDKKQFINLMAHTGMWYHIEDRISTLKIPKMIMKITMTSNPNWVRANLLHKHPKCNLKL